MLTFSYQAVGKQEFPDSSGEMLVVLPRGGASPVLDDGTTTGNGNGFQDVNNWLRVANGQEMLLQPPNLGDVSNVLRAADGLRRAEEFMMTSQGGLCGMNDFAAMSAAQFPGGQWPDAQREGGSPMMGNMAPPSHQDRSSSSPSGDPSMARMPPQEHNPAVLLSLLQQEQECLMNSQRHLQQEQERLTNLQRHLQQEQAQVRREHQQQVVKKRKRLAKSFPIKLMEAINDQYDERVLAWFPDGKSFVVVDPEGFGDNVLLDAFKGRKYFSFVHQLDRWGFYRLISRTGKDIFYNPLFQRDRPELSACILKM